MLSHPAVQVTPVDPQCNGYWLASAAVSLPMRIRFTGRTVTFKNTQCEVSIEWGQSFRMTDPINVHQNGP